MAIVFMVLFVLLLAALFVLAIRFQVKNGSCASCELRSVCKKAAGAKAAPRCDGSCASCRYYAAEQRARQKAAPKAARG